MPSPTLPQRTQALQLLKMRRLVRLSEFVAAGISATTITRLVDDGVVIRLARGLYQIEGAGTEANQDLAQVAKLAPGGVICLVSALAFHELTDTVPARVWLALPPGARAPAFDWPKLQVVRFRDLDAGVVTHEISGVSVRITDPAKTIVDMFRYRRPAGRRYRASPGLGLAIEGLREGLRQRKATPAAVRRCAEAAKVWPVVRPYIEALTHG